jgi:prephenate dehydratase
MFFVELAGVQGDASVAAALEGLRVLCERVLVLGSYRTAAPARGSAASGAG